MKISKKAAVIDLGTNTFHLVLVEMAGDGRTFHVLEKESRFVKLAEQGIQSIGPAPYRRAIDTLCHYGERIKAHNITLIKAVGTAALRTASNGAQLLQEVEELTGLTVEIIEGQREAELIFKGVMQAIPPTKEPLLIMDIGGGSVEFILVREGKSFWAHSFPLGVAVLYKIFHHNEPITQAEINALEEYLIGELTPLWLALQQFPAGLLVGASGTFDVLENLIPNTEQYNNYSVVPLETFPNLYHSITNADLQERLSNPGIPAERAEMVPVAMVLIDAVIRQASIRHLWVSAFALKEGVVAEIISTP